MKTTWQRLLPLAQGAYYLLTGIWPLVHRASFEAVTGPKHDYWLVVMVGLLACAIGSALLVSAFRPPIETSSVTLAMTSAAAFLLVDVFYTLQGIIRPIYLADALPQLLFLISWGAVALSRARQR